MNPIKLFLIIFLAYTAITNILSFFFKETYVSGTITSGAGNYSSSVLALGFSDLVVVEIKRGRDFFILPSYVPMIGYIRPINYMMVSFILLTPLLSESILIDEEIFNTMNAGEKLFLSVLSSVSIAFLFIIYYINLQPYFQISESLLSIIKLAVLSIPFYFILTYTTDSVHALISAAIFTFTLSAFKFYYTYELICIVENLMFILAFFIYSLAIGFHKENTLHRERFQLLGAVSIFFAFTMACMLMSVYYQYFKASDLCYSLLF